jgi:hypothetical protein
MIRPMNLAVLIDIFFHYILYLLKYITVAYLRKAGAIIIGINTMHELGTGCFFFRAGGA